MKHSISDLSDEVLIDGLERLFGLNVAAEYVKCETDGCVTMVRAVFGRRRCGKCQLENVNRASTAARLRREGKQ
jgi:hypothetical protein